MESWRGAYDLPGRGDIRRSLEPGKAMALHRHAAESAGTRAEEGAVAARVEERQLVAPRCVCRRQRGVLLVDEDAAAIEAPRGAVRHEALVWPDVVPRACLN